MARATKYNKALVKRICEELATGKHTIADTCKKVGLSESQFYAWKAQKPEFSEALKQAEEKRLLAFKDMAISGLAKLLNEHEYEEVHTEYENDSEGKPKVKAQKRLKKKILPNATAVIFTLTNRDSDNWKHKEQIDHTSGGKGFFDFLRDTSED